GSTVYVTLYSLVEGTWISAGYTYTAFNASAATSGAITSPPAGATLNGSAVTFNWSAGSGATAYWLDVGAVPGGNQYSPTGNLGNVLTTTVNGLPTDGSTIYATLYSLIAGTWTPTAYTYTAFTQQSNAGGPGAMSSPANGSVLPGSTVTFTWSAGI